MKALVVFFSRTGNTQTLARQIARRRHPNLSLYQKKEPFMKWITRQKAKVDRIACPWLIRHFIDPQAEFLFVPPEQVLPIAAKESGISFDTPGAAFTHVNEKCTFEALIEHYKINDPAILKMARVVHGADVSGDLATTPESAGLKAMAEGFQLISKDDHDNMQKQFALYDALYAYFQKVST